MTQEQTARFRRLQERLGDPLLTVLTILFALMLFVIAPLHAAGIFASEDVGLAVGVLVIGTVVFAYGFSAAVIVLLMALGLAAAAAVFRHQHQSPLDLYLDATAWVLLGVALSWVVARAVFAPGRITYHRMLASNRLRTGVLAMAGLIVIVGLATIRSRPFMRYEHWRMSHGLLVIGMTGLTLHHALASGIYSAELPLRAIWLLQLIFTPMIWQLMDRKKQ